MRNTFVLICVLAVFLIGAFFGAQAVKLKIMLYSDSERRFYIEDRKYEIREDKE